jgi:hypothetical protein
METPCGESVVDRPPSQTCSQQLPPGNHTMLPFHQIRDKPITLTK